MSKEHLLTKGPLVDDTGHLVEAGYHTSLVKTYQRQALTTPRYRLKEWDYYYVGNDRYGLATTLADNGYMWLASVTFFDFANKGEVTKSKMGFFKIPFRMPETSQSGDVHFHQRGFNISYAIKGKRRVLKINIPRFANTDTLSAELELTPQIDDSMVIVTPFVKPKHFYYNQKINLLRASGQVIFGPKSYDFNHRCYGVLDWGRGVWEYKNTWYWSSLSGLQDGHLIGFNFGYGFGDTSKASENMVFYDDETIKLDHIIFDIPKDKDSYLYLKPWHIYDERGRVDLEFTPILDRNSKTNILIISSDQHQVFGFFKGYIKRDNETKIVIKNMIGFAETDPNRW